MGLSGFLAPDGTFTECECWQHLPTAQAIVKERYRHYLSGIQAEEYLYEKGYVTFGPHGVGHRFTVGKGKNRQTMLLTDEQKNFMIENLPLAGNAAKAAMEDMMKCDAECRESSILSRAEEKYLKR